jgi:2-keto-4-pentenoate hydratase/2-oxohepta-3-ene-1,7-dioic acid hydratase in catechol pathway
VAFPTPALPARPGQVNETVRFALLHSVCRKSLVTGFAGRDRGERPRMKLVTFDVAGNQGVRRRVGALAGDEIIDLELAGKATQPHSGRTSGAPDPDLPADLLTLLRGGERSMEAARVAVESLLQAGDDSVGGERLRFASSEVQLRAPLPRPNSLRDFMVIEEHVEGAVAAGIYKEIAPEWYRIPVHYKGNVDEIYGPDDVVPWPSFTDKLDYELEICAVIGLPGRRISARDAPRHIAGYTLYNDWSARDMQAREMSVGIGPGISKDFGSSIGPCLATPDDFDRDNACLEARVDGEVWSTGTVGTMHFSFEEIIEWTSQEQTLQPGDLIGSGTVGKGCGLELDRWLTEGALLELEAQGIGVLRNRVGFKGQGPTRAPVPGLGGRLC